MRRVEVNSVGGMWTMCKRSVWSWLVCAALAVISFPAGAQQLSNAEFNTNVLVQIVPIAQLEFLDTPLLYLEVPPPGSTVPSSGVDFRVTGNADATMVAEPDAFIEVAGEGFMGKAILGAGSIGYKIELRFPRTGVPGSPVQISALPGYEAGPTTPPLTVDLGLTGGMRDGVIHMESNQYWTEDGGIPLPGLYEGHITLTLTASN